MPRRHRNWIRAIASSPDGRSAFTAGGDRVARRWSLSGGESAGAPIAHQAEASRLAFAPDGRSLATGQIDGLIRVWRLSSDDPRNHRLPYERAPLSARLRRDGRFVIAARDSFWRDWRRGRLAGPPFCHPDEVTAVAFTPESRWALTGGRDGVVRAWDLLTGKLVTSPWPCGHGVSSVDAASGYAVAGLNGSSQLVAFTLADLCETDRLPSSERRLVGELASGQQVFQGDLAGLASADWIERWRLRRSRAD